MHQIHVRTVGAKKKLFPLHRTKGVLKHEKNANETIRQKHEMKRNLSLKMEDGKCKSASALVNCTIAIVKNDKQRVFMHRAKLPVKASSNLVEKDKGGKCHCCCCWSLRTHFGSCLLSVKLCLELLSYR